MMCFDTKFFEHIIECLETQKSIHLKPLKDKIMWQDKIDKTVQQCKDLLAESIADEKKKVSKQALRLIPEKLLLDTAEIVSFEDIPQE